MLALGNLELQRPPISVQVAGDYAANYLVGWSFVNATLNVGAGVNTGHMSARRNQQGILGARVKHPDPRIVGRRIGGIETGGIGGNLGRCPQA